jgi:hypothetical protein
MPVPVIIAEWKKHFLKIDITNAIPYYSRYENSSRKRKFYNEALTKNIELAAQITVAPDAIVKFNTNLVYCVKPDELIRNAFNLLIQQGNKVNKLKKPYCFTQ